jgi:adenine-specific DNA-methyltransferase
MSVQARRLGGFDADIVLTDFLLDHIDQQPTAVLCNPPYTRHHQRTTKHKDAIEESIGRRLGIRYTRTASLHALFLARAVEIAAPGARLAFITPSQWLDTRYGMAVKAYVQSHARIVAVVELSAHFFAEVQTSAAITLLQKDRKGDPEPIRMTVDDPLPAPDDLLEQIEARTLLGSKWRRSRSRPRGERLGDLARVRRGVATGHNRFFVLSEARRHEHDIPKRAVVPCIASPRLLDGNALTSEDLATLDNETPRWLLKVGPKHSAEAILKYLEHGKTLGAHQRALSRERNPWYALRWTGTFPILWSYLNQKDPRFVLNQAGAVPLNNWLVIEPHDPERVDELFGRLSSTAFLHHARSRGKHYGRGLWKLEPSDVADLLLPPA